MLYGAEQLGVSQYGATATPYYLSISETFTVTETVSHQAWLYLQFLETFTLSEVVSKKALKTIVESFSISERVAEILNGQNAIWIREAKTSTTWTSSPR